jgi:Tfp pilus assembly protein PilX
MNFKTILGLAAALTLTACNNELSERQRNEVEQIAQNKAEAALQSYETEQLNREANAAIADVNAAMQQYPTAR